MTTLQKIIKAIAIALAIMIIFGIISVVFSIILSIAGVNYIFDFISKENVQIVENSYNKEDVISLNVDTNIANIDILVGDEFKVIGENVSENFESKLENGILTISEESSNISKINGKSSKIKIYIPEDIVFESVDLDVDVGESNIHRLKANILNLNSGTGEIDIKNLEVIGSVVIKSGVGEFNIENSVINNLELESGVGECDIRASIKGSSKIKADIGSISLHLIDFDTTTDKVIIEKGLGQLEINERNYSGNQEVGQGSENVINIEGSIGEIDIEY